MKWNERNLNENYIIDIYNKQYREIYKHINSYIEDDTVAWQQETKKEIKRQTKGIRQTEIEITAIQREQQ